MSSREQQCDDSSTKVVGFPQPTTATHSENFQCFLCSHTFPTASTLANHVESHEVQKAFRCGFCDECFHENAAMLSHISSVHGGLPVLYNCSLCKMAFQVLLSLEEHVSHCRKNINTCSHSGSPFYKAHNSHVTLDLGMKAKNINDISAHTNSDDSNENVRTDLFSQICDQLFMKNASGEDQPEMKGDPDNFTSDVSTPHMNGHKQADAEDLGNGALDKNDDAIEQNKNQDGNGILYKCRICSTSCFSLEEFTLHMSSHDIDELYGIWCVVCETFFDNADLLEKHLTNSDCRGFQCSECHMSFGLETSLMRHIIFEHKQGFEFDMKCSVCKNKRFISYYKWARHEATHAKSLPYVCKICGKHFASLNHVRGYHLRTAHKLDDKKRNSPGLDKIVDPGLERELRKLEPCRKKSMSSNTSKFPVLSQKLKSKIFPSFSPAKMKVQKKERKCRVGKWDKYESESENSNVDCTHNETRLEEDKSISECKICQKTCDNNEKLKEHMSQHALEECYSIRCMKCNICFEDAELLEKHLDDTDCPGYKCSECSQSFGLEALLLKHMVLFHKQGAKMECNECGKKCANQYAWARHEATHAKSQPYMCKICSKHLSSLEHVLRYHLPTAHKLGKKRVRNRKKCLTITSRTSITAEAGESNENVGLMEPDFHKKRRVSSKPITSFTPRKTKDKVSTSNALPDVKTKEEPAEKRRVCIDCDLCGGKVSDHQALAIHRAYHFMEGKISVHCSGCSETFHSLSELTSHVQVKQCSLYKCDECKQIFATELSFIVHRSHTHGVRLESGLYNCLECNQSFESHSSYVDHAAEHVTSQPFQCKICGASFSSMVLIEAHLNETHTLIKENQESNSYKCAQCLETFKTKIAIRVHRRFHMQREVLCENKEDCSKPESSFASYMTSFFCQVCLIGFGGAIHLERHEQMHSVVADKPKCPICGQIFQRNCYLKVHLGHHNRPFLCTACGKTFSSSQTLKHHSLAYHSAENPFQCQYCHKFYSSKGALRHHLKGHTGEKRFECKLCGKRFSDSTCLESHILIHSVEKRFKCKVCNYECRHRSVLARHMDMHNGIKRYKCSYCGMRFRQHSGLKAHLTIHTGEKNYECEYCGKRFARKDYLNVHTLTHTKEKPLSCPICSDNFAVASNLNVHVRKVHGEKAFKLFQEQKARRRGLTGSSINHQTVPVQDTDVAPDPVATSVHAPLPPLPHPAPPAPPLPPHVPPVNSMICPPHLYTPPVFDPENSGGHQVYHQPQQMFYW
ncbi:Zinc finger protein 208 [Plakobranchus ocellatus]|uniref:Zinc finger protein 208 n=1 Tax=Plakobranchus ocellatus TaxID=259542 RepID=A0AAV4DZG4_9GAST|nr:Zinc finger protein 208 [Plakobranchus ocellatus]